MKESLIVYEDDWIIRKVYEVSDRIRTSVTDQTQFEDRCIKRLTRYLKGDASRVRNRRYIEKLIQEEASDYARRYKKEDAAVFAELSTENEEGDEVDFEPIDVLANVESEIIAKEMTALLAQDDHRKKVILGYWAIGNTNHALISRLLAQSLGGNEESHRRAINRFRKDCYEYIASKVVAI